MAKDMVTKNIVTKVDISGYVKKGLTNPLS